jgi:hypothetical protein
MRKMFAIGVTILVMLGGLGLMISEPVNAQYIPVASLTFDESIKSVDVSPGSDGTIVFNGTLHVECDYPTITEFNITGSAATENWTITISPSAVSLPGGTNEENVSVIVKVPLGTSGDVAGTIKIDGTTRTTTPISYSASFSNQVAVMVNKYYALSVTCSEPYKETTPDGNATFNISITNLGNAMIDDLKIDVENKDEIGNWTVIVSSTYLQIDEKETKNVTLNIITPHEEINSQEIVINVSSQTANLSKTYSIYVRVINVNRKPTAIISSPSNNTEFTTKNSIFFDASDSSDPDNDALTYIWTSNIDGNIGTTATFSKGLSSGTHTITLTIDDGNGGSDTKQITIIVNKPPEGKGLIPEFETLSLLSALCICILLVKRKH